MEKNLKLSNQFIGTIMMCLQNAILEGEDITRSLQEFQIEIREEELFVLNPPTTRSPLQSEEEFDIGGQE